MHYKLLILFAFIGLAKASVIINVSEDDIDKAIYTLNNCNIRACEQLCRGLGFPGGACVGDKCKCDNFKPLKLSAPHTAYSLDDIKSCNYQACDQLCRRLGFPGGACVGDRCQCDNFEPLKLSELQQSQNAVAGCNDQTCDSLCRSLDYVGGTCIGGTCYCRTRLEYENPTVSSLADTGNEIYSNLSEKEDKNL